jgi:branched-chain amino acid transport system substrate-binding protein
MKFAFEKCVGMTIAYGAAILLGMAGSAQAANPVGVTDTEIKLGQNCPFSGPASAYGLICRAETAYFAMINEQGGINGRKINLIQYDDGYSPPKTVEVVRKLVEEDQVAFLFQTIGTAPNTAIRKYVNQKKVPDIWLGSGASGMVDPEHYPWSLPFQPSYRVEGAMYAAYLLANKPNAKVGIIYQNDDLGRDYVLGMKDGLGAKYDQMVVKSVSYEITDATIDSQMLDLKTSGADTVLNAATPKFSSMIIRKIADLDWHPLHIANSNASSVRPVLSSAGLDKSVGIMTAFYLKDATDPQWAEDPGMKAFLAWRVKYAPQSDLGDLTWVYGYNMAQAMTYVLNKAGNDLSRENVLKQALSLQEVSFDMLLPGVTVNTSPTDYRAVKLFRLFKFDGTKYELMKP